MEQNKKQKKVTSVIFKILYYAFIALLLGVALLLIASRFPIPGNFQVFVVRSGSMEPAIPTGAVVVTKPQTEYEIGEIITFQQRGEDIPTTHRIVEKELVNNRPAYTTKGDANNGPDAEQVYHSRILGKVLFDLPYVGYAVAAAKQPLGFLIIIVVPALIVVYDEGTKIWQEIKKMKKKKDK